MSRTKARSGEQAGEGWICELRVPAQPAHLRLIRRVVAEAADELGCSGAVAEAIMGAVDEACQNVIRYAYRGDPDGTILLRISREGGNAVVRLIDFAEPVDPASIRPRPLDEVRPGGLGTHLIRAAMDEVDFEPPSGAAGNVLKLVKRIE